MRVALMVMWNDRLYQKIRAIHIHEILTVTDILVHCTDKLHTKYSRIFLILTSKGIRKK